MSVIPGWDSIAGSHWWSNFYFWASIVSLIALGVTEVVSHRYGERKDELAAIEQEATKRAHEDEIARLRVEASRLSADAESSRAEISKANARAEEARLALEKLKTPRTLGPERQQVVSIATAAFKGQRYATAISQGADDGLAFWESLYAALEKAGWIYLKASAPWVGNPPAGIPIAAVPGVEVRFDPAKENEAGTAALALGNALHAAGIVVAVNRDNPSNRADPDKDVVLIVIGARVPPP